MFYEKYLKYKAKYADLKRKLSNQVGGTNSRLEYLDEGAESTVFKIMEGIDIGKVLKVSKKYRVIENLVTKVYNEEGPLIIDITVYIDKYNNEVTVMNIINSLQSINYPVFHRIELHNSEELITKATRSFNNINIGNLTYEIVVMEEIEGHHMMTIFYLVFQNYLLLRPIDLNDPNLTILIEQFSNKFYDVVIKICIALKLAYDSFGFRHNDFGFKNCIIRNYGVNPIPVIIDFGMSTINLGGPECRDIAGFINTSFNVGYCNCCDIIDNNFRLSQVDKNNMIKNCKLLLAKIKLNPKIVILNKINRLNPYNNNDYTLQNFIDYLQRNL